MIWIPENFMVGKKILYKLTESFKTEYDYLGVKYSVFTGKPLQEYERKSAYYTPLQIKLMILILSQKGKKGFVTNLKRAEVAEFLSCSSRSVIDAAKKLSRTGLIIFHETPDHYLHIKINDYEWHKPNIEPVYNTSKEERNNGYLYIPRASFEKLLSVNEKHTMRLLTNILTNADANISFNNRTSFSKKELKGLLPHYLSNNYGLSKFFSNLKKVQKFIPIIFSNYKDTLIVTYNNDFFFKGMKLKLKNFKENKLRPKIKDILKGYSLNDKVFALLEQKIFRYSIHFGRQFTLDLIPKLPELIPFYDLLKPITGRKVIPSDFNKDFEILMEKVYSCFKASSRCGNIDFSPSED